MAAGKYRDWVIAQRAQQVPDGAGGVVSQWVTLVEFWAYVEPIGGREAMRANQLVADMDTRITTRWTTDIAAITAKDRIIHGAVIYNIVRPPADLKSRHREVEITCNSGANDG
ncbi:phage head closure protein [Diaphorobacter sp.]|uniref:phage head closure protein n=1 Tax=Diaphorobacter sp. TaxID=1934310 RepID=UPI0025826E20|nr:phage head closure protein [Diaphorobacter sp.]